MTSRPSFFSDFDCVSVNAVKSHVKGRASGGLMILIRKNSASSAKVLISNEYLLCVLIKWNSETFVVCSVYCKPGVENDYILEKISNELSELFVNFGQYSIIMGGDWNAKLGLWNTLDEELFESCNMVGTRSSLDHTTNGRGGKLVNFMENSGMIVCNGRSPSDSPASFTYLGSRGASIIDMVWVSFSCIEIIEDFEIIELGHLSDHSLCSLELRCRSFSDSYENTKNDQICVRRNVTNLEILGAVMETSPCDFDFDKDINVLADTFHKTAVTHLTEAGMIVQRRNKTKQFNKPWFDFNCYNARKKCKEAYKLARKHFFGDDFLMDYSAARRRYNAILNSGRKEYLKKLLIKMEHIRNPSEFWATVNKFRRKPRDESVISLKLWEDYYRGLLPPKVDREVTFFHYFNPALDSEFTLDEIKLAIKSTKNNKATGADSIPNEYFKKMNNDGCLQLLTLFNKIWLQENIPSDWAKIKMFMLHKKGPKTDPKNYRGISILNNILKIFNKIICTRLTKWTEDRQLIPDTQMGFRRGKGCVDNIYTLTSTVNMALRLPKNKVFAIFIDFKRAFDTINHKKLWQRLYNLGIGGRMLRMIAKLYDSASYVISDTVEIPISEGVLQGDILSPLLFSLFVSDLEDFFLARGVEGITINYDRQLLCLLYADDLVLLARNCHDAQHKLNILQEYCQEKSLIVNTDKTVVVPFRRGGRLGRMRQLTYSSFPLQLVNSFTHLGVPLSSTGKFYQASKHFLAKSVIANSIVKNLLIKAKSDSWLTKVKLFSSISESTLLYMSEIWGPLYVDVAEKAQLSFLKSILQLPPNTPGYIVRLETGQVHIKLKIFTRMMNWWIKILGMHSNDLPRICYKRQIELMYSKNIPFNWCQQLQKYLIDLGAEDVWILQDTAIVRNTYKDIIEKMRNHLLSKDIEAVLNSTSNVVYRNISTLGNGEKYLTSRNQTNKQRIITQLRVSGKYTNRLIYTIYSAKFHLESPCELCNSECDTIYHFLLTCPALNLFRNETIAKYIDQYETLSDKVVNLLTIEDDSVKINNIYLFVVKSLKFRRIMLQ